ncbi:Unknown protein [Striga hermonthica]|uniref:Uncharacterized protein n=1 Tax=Striga hermonthica TaxID=68872 RepID=A0A9N7MD78_STRHE|nr:Unknown protein [Striga hermonthica]
MAPPTTDPKQISKPPAHKLVCASSPTDLLSAATSHTRSPPVGTTLAGPPPGSGSGAHHPQPGEDRPMVTSSAGLLPDPPATIAPATGHPGQATAKSGPMHTSGKDTSTSHSAQIFGHGPPPTTAASPVPKDILLRVLGEDRVTNFVIQEIISIIVADYVKKENLTVKDNTIFTIQTAEELKSAFTPGSEFGFNVTMELEKSSVESS